MKRFLLLALFFVANCFAAHVAVLETIQTDGDLDNRECQFLTDKLRQMAVMTLPSAEGWTIMTRENISEMLPPGKSLEECEGSCLVETGKNISADYVVQGRVSHFGSLLTITVELYETATGKLVSSIAVKSEKAEGLLEEIEKNAGPLFRAINNTPKEVQAAQETGAEKDVAADQPLIAGIAARTDNSGEKNQNKYKILYSLNFLLPLEMETWDDRWGTIIGGEINWSRYMTKETGFSMVSSLTFGYNFARTYDNDYQGLDFNMKYGWGFVPIRDKFLLAFYGLVGLDVKQLFWYDSEEFHYNKQDRSDFNVVLGMKVLSGYQVSDRFGLLLGVDVTADMWSLAIYEKGSFMNCFFAGINIEPYIGISFGF